MEPSRGRAWLHRKIKTRILGQPNPDPRVKKIFLKHILRPIKKHISSLPDHFGIGVKITSKNIFFTLGFWVELAQFLGLGFSVCVWRREAKVDMRGRVREQNGSAPFPFRAQSDCDSPACGVEQDGRPVVVNRCNSVCVPAR